MCQFPLSGRGWEDKRKEETGSGSNVDGIGCRLRVITCVFCTGYRVLDDEGVCWLLAWICVIARVAESRIYYISFSSSAILVSVTMARASPMFPNALTAY